MNQLEEIEKNLLDLFSEIIKMWKVKNQISSNSTYFTFFPRVFLYEIDFPIFEKTEDTLIFKEWITYSFIDNSMKKSIKHSEYKNVDFDNDYSIKRYPDLATELAKYLAIIKKSLSLTVSSAEYADCIEQLKISQNRYLNLIKNFTFEKVQVESPTKEKIPQNETSEKNDQKQTENSSKDIKIDTPQIEKQQNTQTDNIATKTEQKSEYSDLVEELKKYVSDKKTYDFTIKTAINKLNYVSDKALNLAITLIKHGDFSIKYEKNTNGKDKVVANNKILSLCDFSLKDGYTEDDLLKKLEDSPSSLINKKDAPYSTYDCFDYSVPRLNGAVCRGCKYEKCPKAVAILILYYLNKGELELVLKERKTFREHNTNISPYFDFVWTNDIGVKEMSDNDYEFCKALADKEIIYVSNTLNKNSDIELKSKISCKELAIINNNIDNLPTNEELSNRAFMSINRKISSDSSLCNSYTCNLDVCVLICSAYIFYKKRMGKEAELISERQYYHVNQKEIDETIKSKANKRREEINKKNQEKFGDFSEYENKIDDLDSILDMIVNKNQKNLHLVVSGDDYLTDDFIKKIVKVLQNENKIKGVRHYSLQQFARLYAHTETGMIESDSSIKERQKAKENGEEPPQRRAKLDINGVQYIGNEMTYFASPESDYLYILNNVSEFTDDLNKLKSEKNISFYKKSLLNAIDAITEMLGNNYFILKGKTDEIEKLLSLDSKIKFVYQNNIVTLPSLSINDMFSEYLKKIDTSLLKEYRENETIAKNNFEEYVSFARKFMPFDDRGLVNYLASYSNQKGHIEFPPNTYKKETLEESLKNIVGLDSVKKRVREFEKYMMFQIRAKANNIKIKASNMHMIFTGNPGTGKTTVARIMAKMLYDLGLIEENKLIEVERKDLVAEYIGQTATKTSEVIDKAMGGVLFVDEAYTLASKKGSNDFGAEAIATLIKAMEDHKDKLVVIFAGYRDEMKSFLDTNPGISSRIGYTFDFEDYNTEELIKIFEIKSKNMGFVLSDDIYIDLKRICDFFSKREAFGNGRFVDRLLQETIMRHSLRDDLEEINLISKEDIPTIEQLNNSNEVKTKESAKEALNGLIGLNQVKEQMADFEAYVKFVKKAEENGLNIPSSNLHMIFAGNPGTGKTTVARIIAQLLYEIGVIHENKLLEVEKKDLVGQHIGETAIKTNELVERAIGGVLFIDEAYSLTGDSFGSEAVATLIKAMEDHKSDLIVILAGYTKEMGDFLNINPGIASRIGYTFTFEDYNGDELLKIFKYKTQKANMHLAEGVEDAVLAVMKYFCSVEDFGNGRFVDKLFARMLLKHAKNENSIIDTISIDDIPTIKEITSTMLNGNRMIDVTKIDEESQRRTAYHESGHAGVRYLLKKDPNIVVITINAEGGGTLGYVRYKNDGVRNQTKDEFLDDICISCAGRVAEEVFCGDYQTGWHGDLGKITNLTRFMITSVGMSDLGLARISHPGAELERLIYEEQNRMIKECLNRTRKLIEDNKQRFKNVAEYLIAHKEITEEEFIREFDKS